jgi:hypothetical protein
MNLLHARTSFVPINGMEHPVFATDLSAGVAAVARAIGVRQAGDLAYVFDEKAKDYITADALLAHIFPAGDCASAILELCRLAEAAITGLDMSPISELMYDLNDKPIRDSWSKPHDLLLVLADLSMGNHLPAHFEYDDDEQLALTRLFAAIHLALDGTLPRVQQRESSGIDIVGCDECAYDIRPGLERRPSLIVFEMAYAARDGKLDPNFVRTAHLANWPLKRDVNIDDTTTPRFVQLTWNVDSFERARELTELLTSLGFPNVTVHHGYGLVIAQKQLVGKLRSAMTFGESLARRYDDVVWLGAETFFTAR